MPVRPLTNRRFVLLTILLYWPGLALSEVKDGDTFDNWQVNCQMNAESTTKDCFIVQNLVLREGGQRVLQLAVGYVEKTVEPIALLSLPLGISLPPGANIRVDEHASSQLMIERCEPSGCRAGMKLDKTLIERMKSGKQVIVTFFDAQREPIEVPLSLSGFFDGLAALATDKSEPSQDDE